MDRLVEVTLPSSDSVAYTYVSWGAADSATDMLHGFWELPDETKLGNMAEACWDCWGTKGHTLGKCSTAGSTLGSILVAFGVTTKVKGQKRVYIPDMTLRCK